MRPAEIFYGPRAFSVLIVVCMLQYVILISTGITSVNNNDNINGVRLRLKIALDVWKHLRV